MASDVPDRLEIQHTTSGGISFGFATVGSGPPVLLLTPYMVPIRLQWDVIQSAREFITAVATAGHQVLLFDDPYGLSETDDSVPDDFLRRQVDAAVAVFDTAGIDRCRIVGCLTSAMLGVGIAASYPERVESLLLWDPVVAGTVMAKMPVWKGLGEMGSGPNVDFDARAFVGVAGATGDAGVANDERAVFRLLNGRRVGDRVMVRGLAQSDARADLGEVKCPTLVVAPEDAVLAGLDVTEPVASAIPEARLLRVAGAAIAPGLDDHTTSLPIVLDWFAEGSAPSSGPAVEAASDGRLAQLTAREREVCLEVAKGRTNLEIAEALSISRWTVQHHISNAIRKTGAVNRAGLAALVTGAASSEG